jgi:serine/threonine-protein kinase
VYSLGVVAYQLLTGQIPFRGDSAFDALFRAATEPTPPLRSHDPSVPPAVEELVLRMLAKDPQQRFADMNELYREVAGIDEHGCPRVGPVTVTGPQPVAEDSGAGLLPSPADTAVSGVAPGTMTIRTLDVLPSRVGRSRRASRGLIAASIGGLALAGMLAAAVPGFDSDPPAVADTSIAAAPDPAPPTLAPASTPTPTPSMVSTSPEPTTVEPDAVIEIEDEPEPAKSVAPRISRARGPDPAAAPRPAPPPTDAEVRRRIERRARSRCKAQLAGAPLTVTFGIGHRGEVLAPRGDRPGAATACVIELLKSSRFATGKMRKEALSV